MTSTSTTTSTTNDELSNTTYLTITTSIGDNEVLYCPYQAPPVDDAKESLATAGGVENVIFFGGDVQDFKGYMQRSLAIHEYGEYCLESVAKILQSKFPDCNLLLVRPCRQNGYLSIFANFVADIDEHAQCRPSYKQGVGCRHLYELLCDKRLSAMHTHRLHLIGFSRGVNVLTQFIYEADRRNKQQQREHVRKLFARVQSMYFLDGGNGSYQKTLPIDDIVIHEFVQNVICNDFAFHVYGTSYQWKDPQRDWIGTEQTYFVDCLKLYRKQSKKKYSLHCTMYSDEELNASLLKHNVSMYKINKKPNMQNKAIYRHFELLRMFNVNKAKFLL